MRVNLVSKAFTWDQVLKGEEDKEEGVFCDGINGQGCSSPNGVVTPSSATAALIVSLRRYHFQTKPNHLMRDSVHFSADVSIKGPILTTSGAVAGSILLFLVVKCCLMGRPKQTNSKRTSQVLRNTIDTIVEEANGISRNMVDVRLSAPQSIYGQIHNTPGRFEVPYQLSFHIPVSSLRPPPASLSRRKRSTERRMRQFGSAYCLRRKAGSNQARAAFLDYIEWTGKLKCYVYRMTDAMNLIVDPRVEEKNSLRQIQDKGNSRRPSSLLGVLVPYGLHEGYLVLCLPLPAPAAHQRSLLLDERPFTSLSLHWDCHLPHQLRDPDQLWDPRH